MTVKELIEELSLMDSEKEVLFAYPSEDYWGTVCAGEIDSIETGEVEWSDYHRTYKVKEESTEDSKSVIIIS